MENQIVLLKQLVMICFLFDSVVANEELMRSGSGGFAAGIGSLNIALPPIVKKGTAEVKAVKEASDAVACAMVLFRTDKAVLLGAVATEPACRGKRYAGALVTSLAVAAKASNIRVELLCAKNGILEFYKRLGFVQTDEWALIAGRVY